MLVGLLKRQKKFTTKIATFNYSSNIISEMQFIILVCKLITLKMQEILKMNMCMVLFYALLSASGTLYSELNWVQRGWLVHLSYLLFQRTECVLMSEIVTWTNLAILNLLVTQKEWKLILTGFQWKHTHTCSHKTKLYAGIVSHLYEEWRPTSVFMFPVFMSDVRMWWSAIIHQMRIQSEQR